MSFHNVNVLMFSYFEPNFLEKFLWESVFFFFFLILAKIEMMRTKNRLYGRHFETVQHFYFFFSRIEIFYSPYTYGANFMAKFRWESGFLRLGS